MLGEQWGKFVDKGKFMQQLKVLYELSEIRYPQKSKEEGFDIGGRQDVDVLFFFEKYFLVLLYVDLVD